MWPYVVNEHVEAEIIGMIHKRSSILQTTDRCMTGNGPRGRAAVTKTEQGDTGDVLAVVQD